MTLPLSLYAALLQRVTPLLERHLARRLEREKEIPERVRERYGEAGLPRPPGKLVWCHAASVGELVSLLPLVKLLLATYPAAQILITTGTLTSAAILQQRLPERTRHQFIPLDRPGWVKAFLDHWQADLILWVESEIWPNFLAEIGRRAIPAALVNGRLSASSARWWRLAGGSFRQLLGVFSIRLAQSEKDQQRWGRFLPFGFAGNLKFTVEPPPADPRALEDLRAAIGNRPLWLAANTHPDEEARILGAHCALTATYPDLLTIVVPRHPDRGTALRARAAAAGLSVAQRSQAVLPEAATAIYLADTLGELGTFYAASPIAYIGGSFAQGGHSPVEAALLDNAIVCGPDMRNNAAIAALLIEQQVVVQISDTAGLVKIVEGWLADPAAARDIARRAKSIAVAEAEVLPRVLTALQPVLQQAGLA